MAIPHPKSIAKSTANQKRRPSKPVTKSKIVTRHHILVDCKDEAMQREIYERLRNLGVPCRLLMI